MSSDDRELLEDSDLRKWGNKYMNFSDSFWNGLRVACLALALVRSSSVEPKLL